MNQNQLHYGISLKLYFDNKAFGPGMSALLRGIEETGSLQGAAQSMNMAYSKAWKMLKESEKAWGFMLTDRETGGRDGGGSTLTPQAFSDSFSIFQALLYGQTGAGSACKGAGEAAQDKGPQSDDWI